MVIALLPTPPSPTTTSLYVGNGWLGAWVMARRWRVNSCCVVYAKLDDSLSAQKKIKEIYKNLSVPLINAVGLPAGEPIYVIERSNVIIAAIITVVAR